MTWNDPFLLQALVAAVLASLLAGVLGTFVVVRRLTFLAGGISHAAFAGLGICHFLAWPPALGGMATAVLAGAILGRLPRRLAHAQDALVGILWAVGMALGMLFIHWTPGYPPDLGAYLFGNVLLVSPADLALLAVYTAAALATVGLLFKELVAIAFDETFAQVQGVPVRTLSTLLLMLVGGAVVVLLPVVGLLLVLALLTIPALVALRLGRTLPSVLAIATATSVAVTIGGLVLAYLLDAPSGPIVILLGAAVLGVVWLATARQPLPK